MVDGKVILQGGYFPEAQFRGPDRTLEGFGSETPQTVKFPLTQGNHTITVEVENRAQTVEKKLGKKTIFSTADWAVEQPSPVKQDNTYKVVYIVYILEMLRVSGDRRRIDFSDADGKFNDGSLITSGDATFSADGRKISGKGVIRVRLEWKDDPNTDGVAIEGVVINDVRLSRDTKSVSKEKSFGITYGFKSIKPSTTGRGGGRGGIRVVKNGKRIELKDGRGSDANVEFEILSTSPGVCAGTLMMEENSR